jgi:hypothetical protein
MCGERHARRSLATVAGHPFCALCLLTRLAALDGRVAGLLDAVAAARAEAAHLRRELDQVRVVWVWMGRGRKTHA